MYNIEDDIQEVLYSKEELQNKVQELGAQIARDYEDKQLMVVGILKGANIFTADLCRAIPGLIQMEFMVVSSYGTSAVSSGKLTILKDIAKDLTGRHILLVEDIIDTGLTLSELKKELLARGAEDVKICTLLDKPAHRKTKVQVDYVGYTVPDEFIVGYGIDYAEFYRNLPYVAVLKRSVYEK